MNHQLEIYQSIVEDAVDAIFIGNEKGKFIYANKSGEELTGYTKVELYNLTMTDLFSDKQLQKLPLKYKSLNQNKIITSERNIIRKDGSIIPVEMKSKKLETGQYQSFMRNISERKQKEKKLRETETKIRSIMRSAPVGIGFVKNRVLEYVNDHLLELLGYSTDEVVGHESKIFYESMNEFDKVGLLYDKLKSSESASVQTRIKHKSGEIIDVVLGLSYIDKNDNESGIIFSVLDITENKRIQDKLLLEQSRYKNLFENSPIPLWEENFKEVYIKINELKKSGVSDLTEHLDSNPDLIYEFVALLKIINVNQATLNLHNAKNKEELYGSLTNIFTDNSLQIFKKELAAIFHGQNYFESEGEVRTLDNKIKYVDLRLYLDYDNSSINENYNAILATSDITDRILAERQAKTQLELNKVILNTTNDGFIFADENGKIIEVNPAYCKLIGYSANELKEMNIRDLEISVPKEEVNARIKKIMLKGQDNFESRHKTKNGNEIDFSVSVALINYNGKPYGAAFLRDITIQKETMEKLNKSREEISELARHLQNIREEERHYIAREIHDDLGQSLTALKLDASLLFNQLSNSDPSVIKKLESMKSLTDRTIKTVQKISSELRPGILDDLGLAAAIEWETGKFAQRTNIICDLQLIPKELSFSEKINITIFRLFQETCTNVARHSKATRLEIKIIEEKSKVSMEIKDNGIGITNQQINNPKSFGLMGMRERLKNLGGGINFTGEPNKGTTVKIVIPF